jgi:hypothetical protein
MTRVRASELDPDFRAFRVHRQRRTGHELEVHHALQAIASPGNPAHDPRDELFEGHTRLLRHLFRP